MGCASSKIDDLPAVILCRERLDFLSQAVHQRYAFAEAHVAYTHSLSSLGVSLRHFFDSSTSIPPPSASPVINLPPQRKLADDDKGHGHGHDDEDDTGSHLHFHTDSDDDEDDDDGDGLHHDDHDGDGHDHGGGGGGGGGGGEILNHHHGVPDSPPRGGMMYDGGGYDGGGGGGGGGMNGYGFNPYMYPSGGNGYGYINNNGGGNMHVNYMKKHVTPSVSYEQRPVSYETGRVQFGDPNAASSSSSSSNYYDYFGVSGGGGNGGPNYGNYYGNNGANNGYMNMNYGGGGGPGGLFGGPRGWGGGGGGGPQVVQQQQQAKAAPPPPPPPPPATSAWDFMNLFESIDNHYQSYAASRDSREVREEEGIPDLEDEDGFSHQNEVVKEVHGNQKLVDDNGGHIIGSSSGSGSSSISSSEGRNESKRGEKGDREEVVVGVGEGESSLYRTRPSTSNEGVPVEYEVHMVDKKVVGDPGKAESQAKRPVFRNVSEVVHEIQVQFERAASSGNELTKVLEVGKHRYHRKGGAYQVSAKMLNVITPSLPSSSKDEGSLAVDEDVQLRSVNLSATLQKLYLWEKKLFEEVKAEEKMRVLHDRKSNKLRSLADKGAEPQKIESTRNEVRSLSTKIRIAIQIVDRISVKINKLRDEELWPQLNELIQGLSRMWKAMLECHHSQCEAIDGARGLDAIAFPNNPTDSHLEASLQLEHDLLNWTCRFTEWIGAQKGYVRALNGWLLKCISPEPEETDDGPAPFSPGRAGAPPVFVICHQWDQSLERISETSEKDLIDSMRVFSMMVLHFRERDKGELRQRMTANRDMERKVKTLEKEDLKMQKKMVLASGDSDGGLSLSGHVVYQSDTSSKTSLQAGLRHVFEAMDRFTADSVKAYEELLQRSEEVIGEHRGDS